MIRNRKTLALAVAVGFVATVASTVIGAPANPAGAADGPVFKGPVLSRLESQTVSWGRDGGISMPLPNGKVLWIFRDSPRYRYANGQWKLNRFIGGSTAGIMPFTAGKVPTARFDEVNVGKPLKPTNEPAQLLNTPNLYLPDGSGKTCTKANGGPSTQSVRWATGASLMPDKKNVFISYINICIVTPEEFSIEGWGFALYNWQTNRISVAPTDVFAAANGQDISTALQFHSPLTVGNKITMYSHVCCSPGTVYTTTVPATVAALKNPASYVMKPLAGVPPSFLLSVRAPSKTVARYSMYALNGLNGQYRLFSAPAPTGPWTQRSTGTLPGCAANPSLCTNSIFIHPQFSTATRLYVTYYLYGYGPGVAGNPDPSDQLSHVVGALLPM